MVWHLFNETGTGYSSVSLGASVSVDVDDWCLAFIQVDQYGSGFYGCAFWITFRLNEVRYNYLNGWF